MREEIIRQSQTEEAARVRAETAAAIETAAPKTEAAPTRTAVETPQAEAPITPVDERLIREAPPTAASTAASEASTSSPEEATLSTGQEPARIDTLREPDEDFAPPAQLEVAGTNVPSHELPAPIMADGTEQPAQFENFSEAKDANLQSVSTTSAEDAPPAYSKTETDVSDTLGESIALAASEAAEPDEALRLDYSEATGGAEAGDELAFLPLPETLGSSHPTEAAASSETAVAPVTSENANASSLEAASTLATTIVERYDAIEGQLPQAAPRRTQEIHKAIQALVKLQTMSQYEQTPDNSQALQAEFIRLLNLLGYQNPAETYKAYIQRYGSNFLDELLAKLFELLNQGHSYESQSTPVVPALTSKPDGVSSLGMFVLMLFQRRPLSARA